MGGGGLCWGTSRKRARSGGQKGRRSRFYPLGPLKIFSFKNIFPRLSATDVGPQIGLARCRPLCPQKVSLQFSKNDQTLTNVTHTYRLLSPHWVCIIQCKRYIYISVQLLLSCKKVGTYYIRVASWWKRWVILRHTVSHCHTAECPRTPHTSHLHSLQFCIFHPICPHITTCRF